MKNTLAPSPTRPSAEQSPSKGECAVDAGPHREGRRRAREQACVAEELAGRHHRDQVVPAEEVEGAVAKHPELRAGMATLDDHRLAGAQAAVRHRGFAGETDGTPEGETKAP